MSTVNKVDYIKVQTLDYSGTNLLSDYNKFTAGVEYNEKSFSFMYGNIKDINGLDIIKDLYVKTRAFYKALDNGNKESIYNEILLTIAELIFRLRVDLGVNQ